MKGLSAVLVLMFAALPPLARADVLPANIKTTQLTGVTSVAAADGWVTVSGAAGSVKLASDSAHDLVDRCFKLAVVAKATGAGMKIMYTPSSVGNGGATPYSCALQ